MTLALALYVASPFCVVPALWCLGNLLFPGPAPVQRPDTVILIAKD